MQDATPDERGMLVDALRLLRDGDDEAGLVLYRRCLHEDPRGVAAGMHARLLEESGRHAAAHAVRDAAVRAGADLGVRRLRPGVAPAAIADEYLALFNQGWINARMVMRYLIALDGAGRTADVARLLDPTRLLRQVRLEIPDPAGGRRTLAEALERAVLDRETDAGYEHAVQSVRDMHNLKAVQDIEDPVFQTLVAAVRAEVIRLIASWPAHDNPVAGWLPRDFQLVMWALTSRGLGFNTPHFHPFGWYTGIYYVTGLPPDAGTGGVLRIGRPQQVPNDSPGWPDITIRPEPGMLVLMPSYYTHWTEPLGRPGLRISIPFDVIERKTTAP